MTSPGRNAPCPCGSGRAYKNCCLARASRSPELWSERERDSALGKLVSFSQRVDPQQEAHELAFTFFWGNRLEQLSEEQVQELLDDERLFLGFTYWYCFDWTFLESGETLAELFLEEPGVLLTASERIVLERLVASALRPYEVTAVQPGEGLDLKDLWSGDTIPVRERLGSRQLTPWDVLAVRVIEGSLGQPVMMGVPFRFPPGSGSDLIAGLKAFRRTVKAPLRRPDDVLWFFKLGGPVLIDAWLDRVAGAPPVLVTAEGDVVVMTRTVFDLLDRDTAIAALEQQAEIEKEAPDRFAWLQPTDEKRRRILGTIELKKNRLTLETFSESRAEQGRVLLEQALGAAARYRATATEDVRPQLAKSSRRAARPCGQDRRCGRSDQTGPESARRGYRGRICLRFSGQGH